jgi:UDP-2,3-diacylglucosamine pyrophosphatase LpxH
MPFRIGADLEVILHEIGGVSEVLHDLDSDEKLRLVNHRVESWQVYWNDYYGEHTVIQHGDDLDRQKTQVHAIRALSRAHSSTQGRLTAKV